MQKALERDPNDVGAAYGMVDVYFQTDRFDDARSVYEGILEKRPNHLRTLLRLIALERHIGNRARAAALVEETLKAHPDAIEPLILAAQDELERGRPARAISIVQSVSEKFPDDFRLLQVLGRAQVAARKSGEALRNLERLVDLQPDSPAAHYLLSQAFALAGNKKRMYAELEKTLELDPKFIVAALALVRSQAIDGDMKAANRQLATLKANLPDNPDVTILEAWLLRRSGDPAAAAALLGSIQEQNDNGTVAVELSASLWEAGRREEAADRLSNWLDGHPKEYLAQAELANMLMLLDRRDEAQAHYEKLVAIFPQHWMFLTNLAELLSESDPVKAETYAEQAYQRAPEAPPVAMTYASILVEREIKAKQAVRLMRPIVKKYPENLAARLLLARALILTGAQDDARAILGPLSTNEKNERVRKDAADLLNKLAN